MHSLRHVFRIIGLFLLGALVIVLGFFVYFNLPGPAPRQDVSFG